MRYYELIYIVNSNVERKKIDQVMKDISSRLENTNSKIIAGDRTIGKYSFDIKT